MRPESLAKAAPAAVPPAVPVTVPAQVPAQATAQATAQAGGSQGVSSRIDLAVRTTAAIEGARVRLDDGERTEDTYGVEIEKKFALAVACIVFVLLGAPIALRFPRGGVGLTIGVSLVVFAIYYIGLIAGEAVADRGYLSPFWAMWAANILFTAVGLVLLARMGREGSTARGGDMGEFLDQARSWLAKQLRRVGIPVERRRQAA